MSDVSGRTTVVVGASRGLGRGIARAFAEAGAPVWCVDPERHPGEEYMSDFNTSIIEEFRANEGKVGGQFEGYPLILIHHVGAKSGTERVTPVGCFPRSDGRFAIIASNGGAPTNPDWYYNLKAHPEINVELGTETFAVVVRELAGAEREKVWADVVSAVPGVVNTQKKTTRTIPVLLLTRIS